MRITGLDHLVLTVGNVEETVSFYTRVLGMTAVTDGPRHELHFGNQKINLHSRPREFQPAAARPVAGSADFCLVADGSMDAIVAHISRFVPIELGPVPRSGAQGAMQSVYVRDPDQNLVEICTYNID